MRKSAHLLLVTLACLSVSGERLFACSCGFFRPPCQATWEASAVFVGEVTAIGRVRPPADYDPITNGPFFATRASFKVAEAFRGELGPTMDVFTESSGMSCGYTFEVGRAYVVYGHRSRSGQLTTGLCARTKPVGEAAGDLAYLRGPARTPSALGTIQGVVKRPLRTPELYDLHAGTPVTGVRVMVEPLEPARKDRYEAMTGRDGSYSVRVPVGDYLVRLSIRDGRSETSFRTAKLLDTRGCAQLDFPIETDGRVTATAATRSFRLIVAR